jgi:RimJ/RimL family protein N-acetyltransferase
MDFVFQKLGPEHVSQYREIRLRSLQLHPEAYGSTYEEESGKEKLYMEHFMQNKPGENFVAGAFTETGELIGICSIIKSGHIKTAHRAELIQMYVEEKYRNRNAGTGILLFAIAETRKIPGVEQLELGVATNNFSAIKAYRKTGFSETGTIKRALKIDGNYIDEYLMVLFF